MSINKTKKSFKMSINKTKKSCKILFELKEDKLRKKTRRKRQLGKARGFVNTMNIVLQVIKFIILKL